jgi:hypothetical protein
MYTQKGAEMGLRTSNPAGIAHDQAPIFRVPYDRSDHIIPFEF